MKRYRKWLITSAAAALTLLALAASIAAVNPQAPPAATGVVVTNTADGVRVSWNDDAASVHRVGWANNTDALAANNAGDWLEAFHFADTKRDTDYTIKHLPQGEIYWVIVGAANERFGLATWGQWHNLTVDAQTPGAPTPTPVPNTPTPTNTPAPAASSCDGADYDRDEWGSYPPAPSGATATWTLPSDNVNNPKLTHDHHVALKDAHTSGGCDWTGSKKDAFSSDLDNLNPTTGSFNSSKGSRTPDQLTGIAAGIINTSDEKCDYATQHQAVKDEYGLTMTASERATVNSWLALCNN